MYMNVSANIVSEHSVTKGATLSTVYDWFPFDRNFLGTQKWAESAMVNATCIIEPKKTERFLMWNKQNNAIQNKYFCV